MPGEDTTSGSARPIDQREQLRRRRALDTMRRELKVTTVPPEVARRLRPAVPLLAERITTGIQAEVSAYAGSPSGRRHGLILAAVRQAVEHFLDIIEDRPTPRCNVSALFQQLGRDEARAGHDLDAMRAAYHVVTRDIRLELRTTVATCGLPAELYGVLGDAVYAYLQQLLTQTTIGHTAINGSTQLAARRSLLNALSTPQPRREIERLSRQAQWPLPQQAVVVVADMAEEATVDLTALPEQVLTHSASPRLTLVAPWVDEQALEDILEDLTCRRLAHSWPVTVSEIPHAHRWVLLALSLADQGFIDGPRIDCADYRELLWLHADPALGEQVHRALLAPLLDVGAHHRLHLATTLLTWLRTRASAPTLALQLGVHEQTVRNRLHHLRELFDGRLDDPNATVSLLMALEATVPLWQAEDRRRKRTRARQA